MKTRIGDPLSDSNEEPTFMVLQTLLSRRPVLESV